MAKPLTTVVKPEVPATTAPTPEYSDAAWLEIELKRSLMKQHRLGQVFCRMAAQIELFQKFDKEFESVAGDAKSANREKLRLAVKNAGPTGLALAYANFLIRDTKDLTEARKFLMRTKDEDGNEIAPVIREVRGKNNETTLFFIEAEDNEASVEEGDDESEK